ncbi:MAG: glycosyltransferase [Planctomycetia bacterium]|nr:glycosyltransferase [Planctomycetia bacterium]
MSLPLVTIGVCTRKRPEMVVKCLRSLFELETSFKYDIVVVENDEEQTTRKEIETLKPEASACGIELRYYCEPEQNISIARNRCVFVQIGINIFKCLGIIAFYLGFHKEGYR